MEFVDQEEDQDSSLDQGSGDAGYGYPALNRALLAGFVPGAAGPGEGQAGARAGATQPIGERIVNMTAQQQAPSRIPEQEKVSDIAPSLLRLIDVQRPMAALDGLMPAKSREPLPAQGNADSPAPKGPPDANAAAPVPAAWSFDGDAQKGPEFGKPGDLPAFSQEDAGNGPEQSSNGPTDAEFATSPVTEATPSIGDEAPPSATSMAAAVPASKTPPPGKARGVPVRPLQVPQLTGSVGGQGAANKPEDVKAVQRLLNLAVKNEDLPGFGMISEDGKVTDSMLQMIYAYQKAKGLLPSPNTAPGQVLVSPGKGMLRQLASNRLADPRWSMYDDLIKKEVNYYNNFFKGYPGFTPLDWRLAKAMLWTEVQGPAKKEWWLRPLQVKPSDPALRTLQNGAEGTSLFVPRELREQLRNSHLGQLNVRAGVAWLFRKGYDRMQTVVDDPAQLTGTLTKSENLTSFAKRVGTTVDQIYEDNPKLKEIERSLRPGQSIIYRKAHEAPHWISWNSAMEAYNSQKRAPNNAVQVRENYEKIKKVWAR